MMYRMSGYLDTITYFLESLPYHPLPIYKGDTPTDGTPYIYYNCEQMSRQRELDLLTERVQRSPPTELWDYSAFNVLILKAHGITAKHVPLKSPSWYVDKLKGWRSPEYDVGFCGTMNPRRQQIIDKIKGAGMSVNTVTLWGDDRDKELAKCRVLLNIHYADDYRIFESARCEPWLSAGFTIISENSLDNDARCINVAYDELVETTERFCR